jgi:hypothetical protein
MNAYPPDRFRRSALPIGFFEVDCYVLMNSLMNSIATDCEAQLPGSQGGALRFLVLTISFRAPVNNCDYV